MSGKKIERWIDLSVLPKKIFNSGYECIDWNNSEGYNLKFQYDNYNGYLEILSYENDDKLKVCVNYNNEQVERILPIAYIRCCKLGCFFKQPIAMTHPWLIDYFVNKDDAYTYTYGSNKKVLMRCPICGRIREYRIVNLVKYGFVCHYCSDGISYPEKLLRNIFDQLKINYLYQVGHSTKGFEWINGRTQYDFYINLNEHKYFIEMDGQFHFNNHFEGTNVTQERDLTKDELAKNHSIDVIRINCNYHHVNDRLEYIKENIIDSKLNELIDLNLVDWDKANYNSLSSYIIIASKIWNETDMSTIDIANQLKLNFTTIIDYLKTANDLGLCNYNKNEIQRRRLLKMQHVIENNKKHMVVLKDKKVVGVFESLIDIDKNSKKILGVYISRGAAYRVCSGKQKMAKGFNIKQISKEEYITLLQQFNNTKLLDNKEVC